LNLSEIIIHGARYFGNKTALVFEDERYTYPELNALIDGIAAYLHEVGIHPGDRVALYLPNCPQWIVVYYAIIRIGAASVCVSSAYKQDEVKHLINDSKSSLLISSEELRDQIPHRGTIPKVKDVLLIEQDATLVSIFENKRCTAGPSVLVDCPPDKECVILYTGGTTGAPKGAMLTHRNILYTAQNVCYHERTGSKDVAVCMMPLNHVFAGNHIMNSILYSGGTLVLHKGFDLDDVVSSIRRNKVTRFYAVPTIFIRLLNNPASKPQLSSLTYCFSAATSMASEIVRQWQERFKLKIHEAYGMTETASLVTYNHRYKHKIGSVGTPAGIVEVKIVDHNGIETAGGETGEIVIRGPNVMKGYINKPKETEEIFRDGWLHSGDLGYLDAQGYLFIVDRIKDMIISGGLNIYPSEVEDVLYRHPEVEECAVVGVPHPEYGEAVSAYVIKKQDRICTEEDLIRFCKEKIASYKAPKKIMFVKELPKSPAGKILKRVIRKSFDKSD
jgi:long-chain acyl-CoA synthetase